MPAACSRRTLCALTRPRRLSARPAATAKFFDQESPSKAAIDQESECDDDDPLTFLWEQPSAAERPAPGQSQLRRHLTKPELGQSQLRRQLATLSETIAAFSSVEKSMAKRIWAAPAGSLSMDWLKASRQRRCQSYSRKFADEGAAAIAQAEREGLELSRGRGARGPASKTGFVGVYLMSPFHRKSGRRRKRKDNFTAVVGPARSRKFLGRFTTPEAAALCRARFRAAGSAAVTQGDAAEESRTLLQRQPA